MLAHSIDQPSFITTKIRGTLLKNQKMSLKKKVFSKIQLSPKLLHSRISIQQKITTRSISKIIETHHIATL